MKNKRKVYIASLATLCATFLCCAVFAFTGLFGIYSGGNVQTASAVSASDFTRDMSTPSLNFTKGGAKYNTSGAAAGGTYASNEEAWNAAISYSVASGKRAKFTLAENWVASGSVTISDTGTDGVTNRTVPTFGTLNGAGISAYGSLRIPIGAKIQLDLNGKTLDRNLYKTTSNGAATANLPLTASTKNSIPHGFVIWVDGTGNGNINEKRPQLEIIDSFSASAGIDVTESGVFKKGTTTAPGMIRGGTTDFVNDSYFGGGIYGTSCEITLSSGAIAYNYAQSRGGGISLAGYANLYISGGAIAYNATGSMGGAIYVTNSEIRETSGGVLGYNYSRSMAGAIYLAYKSSSVLTLDVNRDASGAPLKSGDTGITIKNNYATDYGGGIFVRETDLLKLGTCTVMGNMSKNGGGLSFEAGAATPEVHDNPYIMGNTDLNGVASNMYFVSSDEKIKVTGKLTKQSQPQIGVFMGTIGEFTTNFVTMHPNEMASDYFLSDNPNYTVNLENNKEGSLILLNSYQAKWNAAVNTSLRNSGAEVSFDMNSPTSLTNWNASNGSFGTGVGFDGGALLVPSGANIKLNLKNYAINRGLTSAQANGYVIRVEGTLTVTGTATINNSNGTITGGMITGGYSSNATGAGVHVQGGTLNLQSGAIYNNKHTYTDGTGIGVHLLNTGSTFTMSGGFVSKNVTTGTGSHDGGGVCTTANTTFNFTGGEISWNECTQSTSSHGAGVCVLTSSTFNMSGGTIKNNTTTACGGGIFMEGTMNFSGGTITNNVAAVGNRGSGAGIFVSTNHILNISGAITVSGNKGSTGVSNDIEFERGSSSIFTVKGALTGSTLGVCITDRTVYSTGLKASGGLTDPSSVFFSNNPAYKATINSSGELIFSQFTTYDEIWQAAVNISKNNGNLPVIFTLASLNKSWEATNGSFGTATGCYENGALLVPSGATIIIDLNGYKIDRKLTAATANGYVLSVRGTCTVKDSDGTTVNASGALVPKTSGRPGGAITGGYTNSAQQGGGVTIAQNAVFNLQSGCIYANKNSYGGNEGSAGVLAWTGSKFNMSGGYISKNIVETASDSNTGGLDGYGVRSKTSMTMSGGEISYNESKQTGSSNGAVIVEGTFTMTGGTIKGNKSCGSVMGLYVIDNAATLSGNITITDNTTSATNTYNTDITLSNSTLKITGKITTSTAIKVRHMNGGNGAFTSGAGKYMNITELRTVFTAANSTQIVGGTGSGTSLEGFLGTPVTALSAANKTYNTAAQTLVNNFDSGKVTATLSYNSGTASAVTAVTGTNAGTYKFVFTLKEGCVWNDSSLNYSADSTVTKTVTATMAKAQVNSISWGTLTKTYDGTALNASVTDFATATSLTTKPTVANMFTIAGTITDKGTAKATATLKDTTNYEFATTVTNATRDSATVASATLTVNARSLATDTTVTVSGAYTYTGSALTPTYTVNNSVVNKNLALTTDFTVTYSNKTNAGATVAGDLTSAGVVTITVTGTGNYTGSTTQTFTIAPRTLATDTSINISGTYTYTGNALTPAYTVNNSVTGANLTKNTDFTVTYSNATNAGTTVAGDLTSAGTVTVKVEGKGNYTGTTSQTFTIAKAGITAYSWDATSFNYDGTAKQPKIASVTTAAQDGLPADVADMFNYSGSSADSGSHTATAVLKDEYAANYEITGASDKKTVTTAFNIALATITVTATAYVGVYDGKKHKILTAMPTASGKDLENNNVKWYFSTNALGANDAGWTEFTAQTDLPEVMNVADTHSYYFKVTADHHEPYVFTRGATVTAKSLNADGTTDFASGISASAISDTAYVYDGTEHTPTVTITDGNAAITSSDYGFTYSNNKFATKSAVLIVTGKGNYAGTVQILYTINQRDIGSGEISVNGVADKTYNNSAQKISPEVNDGGANIPTAILTATTDYTVTYTRDGADTADFTSAGIIVITIKGAGNYTGSRTISYEIKQYDLSAQGAVNIADIANKTYTASEITPEPSVSVTFANGTVTLVKGTDFDYSYTDNKNAGTAAVTVTGKGNYTLSADKTFVIEKVVISSISGITADGKTYDGTTAATIHTEGAVIAGNLDGGNLTILTASGAFNSKLAEDGKTVTVTVTALGGSAADNYELKDGKIVLTATPSNGSSIDIAKLVIEIEWEWTEYRYYDGQPHIPGATVKNKCGEDVITLATSYEGEGSPTQPNRDYIAVVTGMLGADMNNYELPATIRTTYRILTTNAPAYVDTDTLTAVYDGTAKQPVMMAMGEDGEYSVLTNTETLINYTFTFKDANGATLDGVPVNAGVYTVSIQISANYSWSDGELKNPREYTFTISPATVTKAEFGSLDGTLVYDKNKVYSFVIDWSSFEVDGKVIGSRPDGITVTYLYDGAASAGVSGAGTHTVKAVFTVNGNYNAIAAVEKQFVIEKAEIDLSGITLDGKSVPYTGEKFSLNISGTLPEEVSVSYAYTAGGQSYGSDGVSAVGEYTVTATFAFKNAADADNYKLVRNGQEVSSITATLSVGKQQVDTSSLIFEDYSTVYDGNVHRLQVSGTADGVVGITYEYRDSSGALVGTDGVKNAGTYAVTAIFAVDGNYDGVASIQKTLFIDKANLTVKADDKTITYGDNPATADFSATFTGLAGGDTESSLGTLTLRVNSGIYAIYGDAGTYAGAIIASGLSSENYNIVYESGTLTVRQRVITVNWYNDGTKAQYDLSYVYAEGVIHTPYAEVSNALPGDAVTVSVLGGQSEVGINYVARVDGNSISNKNYVLPVNGIETTFDVNPQPPKSGIIIWDNQTLYYNGSVQVPKAYFYEDENDNSPKQLTVTADRTSVNAGTYTATVSYDGNYQLSGDKTKTFTIEKRKVYIEIGDLKATLGNVDVSATGWNYVAGSMRFVEGEVYNLTFSCGTVTAEGTYPIFCTFNCNNSANYEVVFTGSYTKFGDANDGKCGTLIVTAASYDMSGVKYTGLEVTYDGQPHQISISGLPAGVTASVNYTHNGLSLGSAGAVDAGEYTVIISFTGADGYKNIPDVTQTLIIKKAALTVKANDKTIIYGDMPSDGGVVYLLGGAEVSADYLGLEGALTLTVDYAQYGNVGTFRIIPAGLTAKNYDVIFAPGTLTVSPREISVVWYSDGTASVSGTSFIYDYDGNVHTPYAVATGMINGNTVTLTVSVDGGFKSQAGLNYTARITAISNANYCVKDGEASVSFSIIQKNVIIWDNASLVYDGEAKLPEAWYYDDDGAHALIVEVRNESGTVIDAVNAGNYTAYVVGVPDGVTGGLSYGFKISPKAVTVTIGDGSLTYGEVESGLKNLLDGLLSQIGDLPVSLVCTVNDRSNAGEYAITGIADGDGKENYVITFINGKLTIEKANVDLSAISFDGQTKQVTYDGKAQSFEIENLPEGVTRVNYTYAKDGKPVGANEVIAAGTYTVTASFEVDGNHNAVGSTLTATLVIKPAALDTDISFAGSQATYDGNVHRVYVTGDMTGIKGITYEYRDSSGALVGADGVKNAGTYTVTAKVEVEENYSAITLAPVVLKINRASLTVTANNISAVYGETPSQADFGCTATGLALGDSLGELLSLSYTYGTVTKVGEYVITVSGAASTDNYDVTYKNGKLTVTPYVITANDIIWYDKQGGTALGSQNKFSYIYSAGTLNQPYAEAVALVNGERITLTVSGGQINSGYGYIAKITAISGAFAGNYMLPATGLNAEFDVLPKPLNGNIVWSAEPIYYNGEAQAPKAYYYDEEGNEHEFTVTVDGEAVHAGVYTASVTVDVNYTLNGATEKKFEILARPVYIAIGDMTVTYGVTPNVSAVSRSYMENSLTILAKDNYALSFTCGSVNGIGEYAIEGHFTCDNPADYNVTFTGSWVSAGADNGRYGTLKVIKGTYDEGKISFAGTEVTYDGTYHKLVINGLPEGVTAECVYVNGGFGYGNGGVKNAGVYQVTVTFTGDPNYEPIANKTATLTVKQAALTVKANDSEITYGDAPSANGVTYSGFANGEDENTLNAIFGGLTYAYSYTQGDNAGDYTITPAGLTSANYAITFKAGTLTVKPRTITVTWYDDETRSSQNFSYENDGQYHAPYAVAGGLVNGDAVILGVEGEKRAQGYNYVATAVLSDPNYTLPTDGTATQKFTITAKAGSIVWDNSPIYYNGEVQTPKAYYFDEDGAIHEIEGVTVSGGNGINAGDYTAVVYFDGEDRYCPYTILPLEISIVIKNPAQPTVYGTAPDIDQRYLSGWDYAEGSNRFINGENPVRLYTAVVAGYPAGNYAISGASTSANYKINFTEGTLTVCKAAVDISGISYTASQGYDGAIHKVELTGVPEEIASVTVSYVKDGVNYGTDGVREAGVYNLVISFTLKDGANYEAIPDVTDKTFEITKLTADLSNVTFGDVNTVYDGTAKQILVSGSANGVINITYVYTPADAGTALSGGKAVDAGTYYVDATFTFDPNYDVSGIALTMRATLKIDKAELTVTASAGSVVYGSASVSAQAFGYSVTGLASADTESSVLGAVTLSCNGYVNTLGAGEYANFIEISGNTTHKNYVINYVPATLTVTPREITVASWQKGENDPDALLEYDFAQGVSYIPYAVAGNTVNGDNLYLEVVTAKNPVGDGYVATVVGIYKDDKVTAATDYALPAHNLTVNFKVKYENPVSYEIIWNYEATYYNGNALKPSATYYDPVTDNFETVNPDWIETFDKDGNPVAAINAGEYTAKVNAGMAASASLTFTNADEGMSFTVAPRKVYVTVGDASGKYGETHSVSSAGWSYAENTAEENKFIAGDAYSLTLVSDITSLSPVGKYAIRGSFGGNGNYEVIFTGGSWTAANADNGRFGTFTVEKAVLDTSKVIISGLTATYDGTVHTVTVDAGSLPAGVTAQVTYTRGGWNVNGAVDAGEYLVTVTFNTDGNYEPAEAKTAALIVSKAALTVTANPHTIVYGEAPSANGVTYSGFAVGDNENKVGVLTGTVTYEYSYVKGGNVGVYKITPKGVTAANYEITFVSGALTVEKRVITVNWFNDERMNLQTLEYTCDGSLHLPYAEAGNVVAGDSVILTVTGAQSAAGVHYVATVTAISNSNYALPAEGATASFDIIPEAYVIVWEAKPFVYDGTAQKPEAYYFTANGERVALKVTVKPNYGASDSSGSSVYAGEYMAVASLAGGNVTITGEFEHPFTIEKRKVTVIIKDSVSAYGEDIQFAGWEIAEGSDGFVSGSPVYLTTSATKSSRVGTYEITGVYAGSGNSYEVTFINGVYTIEKASAAVPEIFSKEYTGSLLKADVFDTSVYKVYQNDGGINAGSYKVILELLDYDNYKWSVNGEDVRSANYTLIFEITKADNALTTEFVAREIKAGGEMNVTAPEARFGTAHVKYYKDEACTQEVIIRNNIWNEVEGTYYAKVTVAETDNYGGVEKIYAFTVTGKLSLTLYWGDLDREYDGTVFTPKAYITLDGRQIELEVTGGQTNAGVYNAVASLKAVDGTDLSKYEFSTGAGSASTTVTYTITAKEIIVHIVDAESVYGSDVIDINLFNADRFVIDGTLVGTDNRNSLGLSFACDFGGAEFVPAGEYAIVGTCANKNYKVVFQGSMGAYGTYTVRSASINVIKNETAWFDVQGVITDNHDDFVTLGKTDEDGNYKYFTLKGGQTARITYSSFIAKYNPDVHNNMTEEQIKTLLLSDGGRVTPPDIEQGGSWVIYYSIEADNHVTKYGIWKVLIEDPDNYIIITFVNKLPVQYGDVEGKNLLPDLIANNCIELSGNIIPNLTALLAYTEAYAYEDVSSAEGVVNGSTTVGRYTIRFVFNEDGQRLYGDANFKYSTTNVPDSDTNLDKFEVERRIINVELGEVKFIYDGEVHIPAITLKNFVGGEDVVLTDFEIGVKKMLVLSNGDVVGVTVKYGGGYEDMISGSYTLTVEIDNPNYKIGENSSIFVTIEREGGNANPDGIALPTWAIILIAVGGAALLCGIIIAVIVAKKRKNQIENSEEDDEGFNDEYTE